MPCRGKDEGKAIPSARLPASILFPLHKCHLNPPPFTLLENFVMHKAITHVLIYRGLSRILSDKDPLSFPHPRARVVS
jgi:hypothetical protein